MNSKYVLAGLYMLTSISCQKDLPISGDDNPENGQTPNSVEKLVTINVGERYQTIESFGASDCWMAQYVGKYWKTSREGIAKLLFSSDIVNGDPTGIGLTQWRINVGGGTIQQGDASGISDVSRRAESFISTDGSEIDWSNCEGQRFFMSEAKKWGCKDFVLFSNTPPVCFTSNGKGYSSTGWVSNLKQECYGDFANYLSDVASHFVEDGYNISYISPVNEPQWDWNDASQEGCPWTNKEVARLVRILDTSLENKGLDTKILISESGDWQYLYKQIGDYQRSALLQSFFSPESAEYIGNLKHMDSMICGHSYWTDSAWDSMRAVREDVSKYAKQFGVRVWQSEWGMMGDNYSSEFIGYDKATQMDIAGYLSKVIHNDLTVANVTSWSFWTAMDMARWGHKNRFLLVSLVPAGGIYGDVTKEGSYSQSASLWTLGNYSLFIRPGYVRVQLKLNENRFFFGSAWISPDDDKIVAVYSNLTDKHVRIGETHLNWNKEITSIKSYTTSSFKNLKEKEIRDDEMVMLDPMSITTVVYTLR